MICSVENCGRPVLARGWCSAHYDRWRRGWAMSGPIRQFNKMEEFHRLRSISTDECVIWPYATNGVGYGMVSHGGRRRLTHRLALTLATGIDDPDLFATHGPCHDPACMNVRHLRWATHTENMADRVRDGTDARGARCPTARLSETDVRAILGSSERVNVLAERFAVSRGQIYNIKKGAQWREVWDEHHRGATS